MGCGACSLVDHASCAYSSRARGTYGSVAAVAHVLPYPLLGFGGAAAAAAAAATAAAEATAAAAAVAATAAAAAEAATMAAAEKLSHLMQCHLSFD